MKLIITVKAVAIVLICLCFSGTFSFIGAQSQWDIQFSQSYLDCTGNQVCYQITLQNSSGNNWTLGDQNYRLFFDGDLMTVVSVSSLLPSTFYSPANIDQNIKITGQGQETASPLDNIDDHLGFLDFSIIQSDKLNPPAAVQLSNGTFTPVAEICVIVTAAAIAGSSDCLHFYHSRPSTAGGITNQYTVISENDVPGNTIATTGNVFDDLTAADGDMACLSNSCTPPEWDIQFSQTTLDCPVNQVCYQLEVKNNLPSNWTIGDQNYRLFFDGDLMTIISVTSLLPNTFYDNASIDQNIKITGQGQEAASPLDDIDDHLGFLDFNIVQTNKNNPNAATQLIPNVFTPVAEICVEVDELVITDANTCLSFYHSRPSTAGSITNQYIVLSENDSPGSTIATEGGIYDDLTSEDGNLACLSNDCPPQICDLTVSLQPSIYNDNGTANNLSDDTFSFELSINGSNPLGWIGGGQSGNYGTSVTFGPYPVDQNGASFKISDAAIGTTCFTNIGANMNSCIYMGTCACCQGGD